MIITKYTNGGYEVTLHSDGTKVRERVGTLPPMFPESIDLKITNYCDAGCAYCHENSTTKGLHGDLSHIAERLVPGMEIAIGGGNPLSHPGLREFLQELKQKGCIANITVNEQHFGKDVEDLIADGLVYGVGYSYRTKPCYLDYEHLVTHIIVGVTPYQPNLGKKLLLLGYKDFGRGVIRQKHVNDNIKSWYIGLFDACRAYRLLFDNLAITQLNPKRLFKIDYDKFYMGNDGEFTMYVDAVEQTYAVCSTSTVRHPIDGHISDMFKNL